MDLEEKLKFLTGNDEYSMPSKNSHNEDDFPVSDGIPSHFVSTDDDTDNSLESISIDSYLRLDDHKPSKKSKKKEKEIPEVFDSFDEEDEDSMLSKDKAFNKLKGSKIYSKITKRMSASMIDEFESFLDDDSMFDSEESDELRNGLVSMGRKYARDTGISSENSEITKTFSDSEKKLKSLYDEISKDKINIQKDID